MARQEEADGIVFPLQSHRRRPGFVGRIRSWTSACRDAAEHVRHAAVRRFRGVLGQAHDGVDGGAGAGAVRFQFVEGAGCDQVLERPLVEEPRVEALGEVGEARERLSLGLDERSRSPAGRRP